MSRKLVTKQLGLELNERLAKLAFSRIEYGYKDSLMLSFAIQMRTGLMVTVSEEEFAASKGAREVGIFGCDDPTEAVRLVVKTYPNAVILMRKDPKRR